MKWQHWGPQAKVLNHPFLGTFYKHLQMLQPGSSGEDSISKKRQHGLGWGWQPLGSSGHGSIRRALRKAGSPGGILSWECKAEGSHWAW